LNVKAGKDIKLLRSKKRIYPLLKRIKSGIPGLDKMFRGGVFNGNIVLVEGDPGAGKTVLGLQFILEGLKSDESCIYISFMEDPSRALQYFNFSKVDFTKYIKNHRLSLIPSDLKNIKNLSKLLKKLLSTSHIFRVFIDNLPVLSRKDRYAEYLPEMVKILREYNVTTVITTTLSKESGDPRRESTMMPEMADCIIKMKQIQKENKIIKTLVILKSKGIAGDSDVKLVEINESGMKISGNFKNNDKQLVNANTGKGLEVNIPFEEGILSKILSGFKEKYPEVTIARSENITSAVSYVPYSTVNNMAVDGLLLSLDTCIDKELFSREALDACSIDGKLYGIPDDFNCRCLLYRKDLLEKYSLPVPADWDSVISTSKLILKKENNPDLTGVSFPFGDGISLVELFLELVWSNGADIYDLKGNTLLEDIRILEALELLRDLVLKYKLTSEDIWNLYNKGIREKMTNGSLIFGFTYPELIKELYDSNSIFKDKIWFAPFPKMSKGEMGYAVIAGAAYIIPKNIKNQEAAVNFVKYVTGNEIAKEIEARGGWPFPSRISFWADEVILKKKPYYAEAGKIARSCVNPYNKIKNYRLFSLITQKEIVKVLKGEQEPQKGIKILNDKLKKLKRFKLHHKIVEKTMAYLENNLGKTHYIKSIAQEVKISPKYLQIIFKLETGMCIIEYLNELRVNRAKLLLKNYKYNVREAALKVGCSNMTYFGRLFKKKTGILPNEYRLED